MSTRALAIALALVAAISLSSCRPEPFALVAHDFGPESGAKLDQPLVLTFNDDVDPGSARVPGVRVVRERDGVEVAGTVRAEGAAVIFEPRLPVAADLADAGLQPGERYRVEVPGLPVLRGLRGLDLGALAEGTTLRFATIDLGGRTLADAPPAALFVDPVPGPPALVVDGRRKPALTTDGRTTLRFSEPLDPRALARARFKLEGPWSQDARKDETNPLMAARLVENQTQAVIELAVAEPIPRPLRAGESHAVLLFQGAEVHDLAGNQLADPWAVTLEVER